MNQDGQKGTWWETVGSLAFLVAAVLVGIPAVGSSRESDFWPFIVTIGVAFGIAVHGLRKGRTWNRIACSVCLVLLVVVSGLMALAVRIQEPP
jgi:hypothetical protein